MTKRTWYVNTDTVDIDNRSIGIKQFNGKKDREHCIQVKHLGTKQSVKEATKLAEFIAQVLNQTE